MTTATIQLRDNKQGILAQKVGRTLNHVVKYVANNDTGVRDAAYSAKVTKGDNMVLIVLSRPHYGRERPEWNIKLHAPTGRYTVTRLKDDTRDVSVVMEFSHAKR